MSSKDDDVLRGLAANPAAPVALLLELLATHPEAALTAFRRRELPEAVLEAMLSHPSPRARDVLAGNPRIPYEWRRRLADAPDIGGRRELDELHSFHLRGWITVAELGERLTDWVSRRGRDRIAMALGHPDPIVRQALTAVFRFPYSVPDNDYLVALTRDESADVRAAAAAVTADLTARRTRGLVRGDLRGPGHDIRYMLSLLPLSPGLVTELIAEGDPRSLVEIVANPSVPGATAAGLITHPDPEVRRRLAERPDLTPEQLTRLAADPDIEVRRAVARSSLLPVDRVVTLLDDPELAESAAANPALPEERMWELIRLSPPT